MHSLDTSQRGDQDFDNLLTQTLGVQTGKLRKIAQITQISHEKDLQWHESVYNRRRLLLPFLTFFLPMKKQDFIKAVSVKAGLSQDAVASSLNVMIDVITATLKKGGDVNITGFGAFKVSSRKARQGINPKTLKPIKIPAMKSPVFRAGKTLKEAVR